MEIKFRKSKSAVKPEAVEIGKTTVFLRTDIKKETLTDGFEDSITLWTYQEAKMTPDEFTAYASLVSSKDAVTNTTINNQLVIMDAIADLYERISRM